MWLEKLLTKILPYRDINKVIMGEEVLYLRRFFLWRRQPGSKTGDEGGVFLHVIHRNDDDRDPHDHPWPFKSLILGRGYLDEQWTECFGKAFVGYELVRPLQLVRRSATHLHRVRGIEPGKPAWTLVWTGPKEREWGFVDSHGWINALDYLGLR